METITTAPVPTESEWEAFLGTHPEANFLHSWYWGDFQRKLHKQIARTGIYRNGKLEGVIQTVVEPAKRARYLTVTGGPILDWHDDALVRTFAETVKGIAKQEHCVFVRVRPQLLSDAFSRNLFSDLGFREAPMHLEAELTSQLDLSPSEDSLLAAMRKTTRYEIRKAGKLGIAITTTKDSKEMRPFYELQMETAKRQQFVPFSYPFLAEQFMAFAGRDMALLYSAFHEKTLLAQAFIIFYGSEAVYHYGASTENGRNYPGAYLIQWEAIREAKRRGMKRYNFWGITRPEETGHRFYGVSVFKRGFGGTDTEYLHAQDLVIDRIRYAADFTVEYVRKKSRRL